MLIKGSCISNDIKLLNESKVLLAGLKTLKHQIKWLKTFLFNTRLKTDSALEFVHNSCVKHVSFIIHVIIVIVTIACSALSRTSVNLIFCVVKPQGKYEIKYKYYKYKMNYCINEQWLEEVKTDDSRLLWYASDQTKGLRGEGFESNKRSAMRHTPQPG